jgi:hypothetical protein
MNIIRNIAADLSSALVTQRSLSNGMFLTHFKGRVNRPD